MRLTATNLRVVLLVVNLILPFAIAGHYVHSMWLPSTEKSHTKVYTDMSVFRYVDTEASRSTAGNTAARVANVAAAMQPKKEVLETVSVDAGEETVEETSEDEGPEEGELEGGPLDEEWEYAWGIQFPESPRKNLVVLRKKSAQPVVARPIRSSTGRTTRLTSARIRSSVARARGVAGESISFKVQERKIVKKDLGLEFYAHSATRDRFVYWMEDTGPGKKFALRREQTGYLSEEGRTKRLLNPPPDETSEDGSGAPPGEEEEEKHFRIVPRDFEDLTEEDYELLEQGKAGTGALSAAVGSVAPKEEPGGTSGKAAPAATGTRRPPAYSGRFRPVIGPNAPSAAAAKSAAERRAEGMRQLQSITRDPKVPEEARQKIQEVLQGKKQ